MTDWERYCERIATLRGRLRKIEAAFELRYELKQEAPDLLHLLRGSSPDQSLPQLKIGD